MMRKHLAPFVALLAVGMATLTACGSTPQAPQPARAEATNSPATPAAADDLSLLPGTAKSNNSPAGTGDWAVPDGGVAPEAVRQTAQKWVQLTASRAGDLNPVVVNGAGLTLYRFDKDSNNPSKSNCSGDCATTWPPVDRHRRRQDRHRPASRRQASASVTARRRHQQLTIGGWPVYRFAKDTKPGDTNGPGRGRHLVRRDTDGGKAGAPADDHTTPDAGGSTAPPATSAVLFDDANFSDNGASQGAAGSGCRNLSRPGVASSVAAPGSLKLWTGPNCTGRSTVINGDVADLATIGFDDAVASVRFN